MKEKYISPEINVDSLLNEDVLCVSIGGAIKDKDDNTSFSFDDLINSSSTKMLP